MKWDTLTHLEVAATGVETNRPLLFAVGDECGFTGQSVKRYSADYSHSCFRELRARCISNGLPIYLVTVGEAFSSQVCVMVDCLREPSVEEWKERERDTKERQEAREARWVFLD